MEAMVGLTIVVGMVTILLGIIEAVQQQSHQNEESIAQVKQKYYREQKAWLNGEDLH
ncbi:hypothetical protein GA0061074_10367 [Weissella bombi]|uniref:Uncharacterized protein n=1 Tax=Weissella bombi TaxID=1505725 RepID=A0A1C3ZYZ3_9LACO|nr:hypothetical protein GA0061074_10367 [Weissella bombi]